MTCPACGGTDAEDGPGCVCQRRPAGHAPGVIPGVPVLTQREYHFLDVFLDSRSPIGIPAALDASPGLVACGCMAELRYRGDRIVSITDLGRAALAAHRLGLATRASFTIDTGAS